MTPKRARKPDESARRTNLNIRANRSEKAAWERAAPRGRVSRWVRETLNRAAGYVPPGKPKKPPREIEINSETEIETDSETVLILRGNCPQKGIGEASSSS